MGHEVLPEPFDPTGLGDGFLTVAFVLVDGAVVEFMQYVNPNEEGVVLSAKKIRRRETRRRLRDEDGSVRALDDFSWMSTTASSSAILGPSGCGKTTLLWAMSGLHGLTGGRDP